MPVQTQMSSFAKKLGGRVAQANAEHRDKPVDTGIQNLPPGIRNGTAKLATMMVKEYPDDKNGPGTRGMPYFRAAAVVLLPDTHNGQRVAGLQTSVVIPLCDIPAKGQRKEKTFSNNWFEFQNLFKLLGIGAPDYNQQTDPTGQLTEAYYFAAMKTLTDPQRPPVYIHFSTRGWTPAPTPQQPKPEQMVFEDWHGLAQFSGTADPGAGVVEASPAAVQPEPFTEPPQGVVQYPGGAPAPSLSQLHAEAANGAVADPADEVAALVETAMNDPEGATEEGGAASQRLEELAWVAGWSKDQTKNATDWAQVGDMCLNPPTAKPATAAPTAAPTVATNVAPAVGAKHRFAKRTKDGLKLKNNKGEEFPPQDVEVTAVDAGAKTCTVKTVKDGKDVVDIRTKQPVAVKFEWLE